MLYPLHPILKTDLRCHQFLVTNQKIGETFKNFVTEPDCLYIGDRGYAHRAGIAHIVKGQGDVIVRLNLGNVPLKDRKTDQPFDVLNSMRSLVPKQVGDWDVYFEHEKSRVQGRLCAIKKSEVTAEKARQEILKEHTRKQKKPKPETLEAAGYILVLTTLNSTIISPSTVLEIYRGCWQVEIAFKRLKSLLGTGHVPKKDPNGANAWIQGKLLSAILIEKLIEAGEFFFPWGYPLAQNDV